MNQPEPAALHLKSKSPGVPGLGMRLFLLSYVLFVFVGPLLGRGTFWDWAVAVGSVAVFLPLYIAAWAAIDRGRDRQALACIVGMAALGLVLIPFNLGANTYVVYSAAFVPFLLSPRFALAYVGALIVAVALVAVQLGPTARLWLMTAIILMVGGGNFFYAQYLRRNELLWRAKEEVEEMATLAERERISRDLHDILGHTLSVIALKSELASRLADSDPVRAAEEIREVERVSRDALSEVRGAVEGYRRRGFSGELQNAARVLESSGVRLEATIAAAPMPPRQESVLALALREAVTNIVRHAHATHCHVTVAEQGDRLVLTVRDDGAGGMPREGLGLTGMRERVAAIGGSVTIAASTGTTVTVSLPVRVDSSTIARSAKVDPAP
jgi:two-component system, NarL family, sensor histidine kinase DesK